MKEIAASLAVSMAMAVSCVCAARPIVVFNEDNSHMMREASEALRDSGIDPYAIWAKRAREKSVSPTGWRSALRRDRLRTLSGGGGEHHR